MLGGVTEPPVPAAGPDGGARGDLPAAGRDDLPAAGRDDATAVGHDDAAAERWLRDHRHGTPAASALAFVDSLPGVPVPAMTGRWYGAGWHTGHPWDGLLEAFGWWGKEVVDAEHVRPLLVRDAAGDPRPVDPVFAPVAAINAAPGLFRHPVVGAGVRLVRPLLGSARPGGRLRVVEHRGTPTAALLYDRVPVVDAFRRVTDDLVVGAADIRGQEAPLLFVLRRAPGRRPATARVGRGA